MPVSPSVRLALAAVLALTLAACGKPAVSDSNLDALDAELAGNTVIANNRDPAMMAALSDQIMVDPALTGQANNDALRPPPQPYSGAVPPDVAPGKTADASPVPATRPAPAPGADCPDCQARRDSLTLGGLAQRQRYRGIAGCTAGLSYTTAWATRLPAELGLYPDARVSEAAGVDQGGCTVRIVSFASAQPLKLLVDWYYTKASGAGYAAEHEADGDQHVVGGTRGDGAAFVAYLTARPDGGTDVDLVTNKGG